MALGATRGQVLQLVMSEGVTTALLGTPRGSPSDDRGWTAAQYAGLVAASDLSP